MKITSLNALTVAVMLSAMASIGCHSTGNQYERSTGQMVDDKALASSVKDALKDNPVYKLDEVVVNAFRGTIQLSGFVSTEAQQQRAGEIAEEVIGVQNVENNISIKPGPLRQQEITREEDRQEAADRAADDRVRNERVD